MTKALSIKKMEQPSKTRKVLMHLGIGILVPLLLLINAFLIPEPYSHPFIHVGLAPIKIMPFLENRELMRELTVYVFGRMTPNYAPITILFLIAFWCIVGTIMSYVAYFIRKKKNA